MEELPLASGGWLQKSRSPELVKEGAGRLDDSSGFDRLSVSGFFYIVSTDVLNRNDTGPR